MSFLSDADSDSSIQYHFDELTVRITIVFISMLVCIGLWSLYIDEILSKLVDFFSVCVTFCLNIYDPTQWSRIRWFSTILLGVISILPLLSYHMYQFAKIGLLPKEKKLLRTWLTWTCIAILGSTICSLFFVRTIFEHGHRLHIGFDLVPKYDVVEMLNVWLNTSMFILLMILTYSTFWLMNIFGILTSENKNLWTFRIFGFGALLILVSFPAFQFEYAIFLCAIYFLSVQFVLNATMRIASSYGEISDILDSEGRRIRNLIADCSCDNAMEHSELKSPNGMKIVQTTSICSNPESRNEIMHQIIHNNCTHLTILGCDAKACPSRFNENLIRLNVSKIGLNLHSLSIRKGEECIDQVDFENHLYTNEEIYGQETVSKKYEALKEQYGTKLIVEEQLTNKPLAKEHHTLLHM